MYVLKLIKVLDGTVGYLEFIRTLRGRSTEEKTGAADGQRKDLFDEKQIAIWYELVQCLYKRSVLFLRPYRGN